MIMPAAVVFFFLYWPLWIILMRFGTFVVHRIVFIFLITNMHWRCWQYDVFVQLIYIQCGILLVARIILQLSRVQQVDTKKGPILRKFSLASVTISTAATTHEIPALIEADASALRDRISTLARVDEDDV